MFVDRDGVINELVRDPDSGQCESPLEPQAVRLIPGATGALRSLRDAGFVLVCVTNQPAAAKAKTSLAELERVQARVRELLSAEGVELDAWKMCPHHPQGTVPGLARACDCRKPAPGMLLEAAREHDLDLAASWIVGDTDADVLAGAAAGCRTVLVEHPGSAHKRVGSARPWLRARDLADGAAQLLASHWSDHAERAGKPAGDRPAG